MLHQVESGLDQTDKLLLMLPLREEWRGWWYQ